MECMDCSVRNPGWAARQCSSRTPRIFYLAKRATRGSYARICQIPSGSWTLPAPAGIMSAPEHLRSTREVLNAGRLPSMDGDESLQLQLLIDRAQQGDDAARQELVGRAYERLRLLARKMLHADFPRLQNLHATGSVLDEAVLRLLTALKEV